MNEQAVCIAERNVDTIIDSLCTQIQNQQSLLDFYRARIKTLEIEISVFKMKYEGHVTDREEEAFLNV